MVVRESHAIAPLWGRDDVSPERRATSSLVADRRSSRVNPNSAREIPARPPATSISDLVSEIVPRVPSHQIHPGAFPSNDERYAIRSSDSPNCSLYVSCNSSRETAFPPGEKSPRVSIPVPRLKFKFLRGREREREIFVEPPTHAN